MNSPNLKSDSNKQPNEKFGFGLEAEYLLIDKKTGRPLFCEDLNANDLLNMVEGIPVSDIGIDGFNIKPLHRKAIPYLIEGYYLTDDNMKPLELLPKGIELRTPIANSIEESIETLKCLTSRLNDALTARNWALCSISHHPYKADFFAKRNYRRDDYWQWALTAMTTFGPDINISLPSHLASIDLNVLEERINYYMPPLVALSFASPFEKGKLWEVEGKKGYSVRTYKRSLYAPLFYVHTEPQLRFEFKGFEMPVDFQDYAAFFLVCLAILLDENLTRTASNDERINRLRELAVNGLTSDDAAIAQNVVASAKRIAQQQGFNHQALKILKKRIELLDCPAKAMIAAFERASDVESVLDTLILMPDENPSTDSTAKRLNLQYSSR